MAQIPKVTLSFKGLCPDCGERKVDLPPTLPEVGDDFDWLVRDFDSFRRFMLEELAARFPERSRWTPADLEVVIVEVLAAVLDQLSDMADRVAVEGYLESARRPVSVRTLLQLIGYDAVSLAGLKDETDPSGQKLTKEKKLERLWTQNPVLMDSARREGPLSIKTQKRMVTLEDYGQQLQQHPLVLRAHAWNEWSGSWYTVYVAIICWGKDNALNEYFTPVTPDLKSQVDDFHGKLGLLKPTWEAEEQPTIRTILQPFIETFRVSGQEVVLQDAIPAGIIISLSVQVANTYFQSEIKNAVEQALGTGPGGFFEPGNLQFGEDLYASDLYQLLMALDGVENVCINRFKRFGSQYPDQMATGRIVLGDLELAVCDNDPAKPERGYVNIMLHGGRKG